MIDVRRILFLLGVWCAASTPILYASDSTRDGERVKLLAERVSGIDFDEIDQSEEGVEICIAEFLEKILTADLGSGTGISILKSEGTNEGIFVDFFVDGEVYRSIYRLIVIEESGRWRIVDRSTAFSMN